MITQPNSISKPQTSNLKPHTSIRAQPIVPLVRRFLLAEAQLNYGDAGQTDRETVAALGERNFAVRGVKDGERLLLPKGSYQGSPTPLGVEVFEAPHKSGVPAVSCKATPIPNP